MTGHWVFFLRSNGCSNLAFDEGVPIQECLRRGAREIWARTGVFPRSAEVTPSAFAELREFFGAHLRLTGEGIVFHVDGRPMFVCESRDTVAAGGEEPLHWAPL